MSEALDKVRGVRELPIFPLPLVLFPGVPLPLHIFEERYRRMLADVRASNNLFGLSYFTPDAAGEERPPEGHVGCATEVVEVQPLPDGRSNILTLGVVRYRDWAWLAVAAVAGGFIWTTIWLIDAYDPGDIFIIAGYLGFLAATSLWLAADKTPPDAPLVWQLRRLELSPQIFAWAVSLTAGLLLAWAVADSGGGVAPVGRA